MFKKIAAIGLGAALALSPLAALAQTDQTTAPAAPAAGAAPAEGATPEKAPMKHHAKHKSKHMAKKKAMEPAAARRPRRSCSEELIRRTKFGVRLSRPVGRTGRLFLLRHGLRRSLRHANLRSAGERDGDGGVLVRVCQHLFLSGRDARRRARRVARRGPCLAAISARTDLRRPGLARFAVQHLSGQGPLHVARHGADLRRAAGSR